MHSRFMVVWRETGSVSTYSDAPLHEFRLILEHLDPKVYLSKSAAQRKYVNVWKGDTEARLTLVVCRLNFQLCLYLNAYLNNLSCI